MAYEQVMDLYDMAYDMAHMIFYTNSKIVLKSKWKNIPTVRPL